MKLTDSERSRFLSKLGQPDSNGCIEWLGRRDRDGYGVFDIRRGTDNTGKEIKYSLRANIVAWEVEYDEEFPKGLYACHTCDNPPCCNARDHLYPGTPSDNMVDRRNRGRDGRKESKSKKVIKGGKIHNQLDEILKRSK